MSFSKDTLLHKLQDEADKKERDIKEVIREALYGFIDYYSSDEFERVDLKLIADTYLESKDNEKNNGNI